MKKISINNYEVYYQSQSQFKTISVGLYCFLPFDEKSICEMLLLSQLLTKTNSKFPNEKDYTYYLEECFDMRISASFSLVGRTQLFRLSLNVINDEFISTNENLFEKAFNFMLNTFYKPSFTEQKLEMEKKLLIEEINRQYENKSTYAIAHFMEEMYKGELAGIPLTGRVEDVKKVTIESLNNKYQRLLHARKCFYILGHVEEERVINIINKINFYYPIDNYNLNFIDRETKNVIKPHEVIEQQDISQSILCIGYRLPIYIGDQLANAAITMSSMLGSYFHSTLFMLIREKYGLAYSISTEISLRKGYLNIYAGISSKNYQKVLEIVKKVIDSYQNNKIDDRVFELTKNARINDLRRNADTPGFELYHIIDDFSNRGNRTYDDLEKSILNVKKSEVVEASRKLVLDTIYLLKGSNDEEKE